MEWVPAFMRKTREAEPDGTYARLAALALAVMEGWQQ
jgi:TorA maturation chaperone TorD